MTDFRTLMTALGAEESEIDAADANGTLLALAAERFLLPGERKYNSEEVGALAGLDPELLDKLWLALGFPQPEQGERAFSERDVDVMRVLLADGTTLSEYTLHEARVISSSLARIAEVFIDEMWDEHFSAGQSQTEALGEMAESIDLERVEQLLLYLLRRQIIAALYRRLALRGRATQGVPSFAIGFADIAGYSAMSQALDPDELIRLVVLFERRTHDLVAEMNGRVVKTIGDEVMFLFEDAPAAARFAQRLSSIPELPALRIGLGWGPVLTRQGDCFGPTVNLASRVVGVAGAGEIVVESGFAEALRDEELVLVPLGERMLKGFGDVSLWRLEVS